ncbi:MAG: hypothetical protein ACE5HQ_13470 [Gemmatimonadota bacterium]
MERAPALKGEGTRRWMVLAAAALALALGRWVEAVEDRSDEVADLVMAAVFLGPLVIAHATLVPRVVGRRSVKPLGIVWRGFLTGLLVGIPVGVGLRIGMRLVALLAAAETTFTVGGSLFVLAVGVSVGAAYGSLYPVVRRWLPERGAGLAFGLILGAFFWFGFFAAAAGDLRGVASEPVIGLLTTLIASLWLGYGALLDRLMRSPERAGADHGTVG